MKKEQRKMGNTAGKPCVTLKSAKSSTKKRKFLKNTKSSSNTEQQRQRQQQQPFLDYKTNSDDNDKPPPLFTCEICVEQKHVVDSFSAENCTHFYCTQCTVKYIEAKLGDNVLILTCPQPECAGVLEPFYCRAILPHSVLMRWERALCEQVIPEKFKFYCPFEDCSALLINEGEINSVGGRRRREGKNSKVNNNNNNNSNAITDSVCPHCGRKICVQCKTPWHEGFSCVKFQRLKQREDSLTMDLAERKKWRRCPKCRHYVEKKYGCNYIKCRCQHLFCYKCGDSITSLHRCK